MKKSQEILRRIAVLKGAIAHVDGGGTPVKALDSAVETAMTAPRTTLDEAEAVCVTLDEVHRLYRDTVSRCVFDAAVGNRQRETVAFFRAVWADRVKFLELCFNEESATESGGEKVEHTP